MSKTKTLEIKCSNCDTWFPSPIVFGDMNTFDVALVSGNKVQCPKCAKIVDCNKENMRVISENGGFRGNETY